MTDTLTYVLASIKRTSENDYSWLIMPHEGAVLVAEVERLRGEAERERAAVVAWLRDCALDPETTGAEMRLFQNLATTIERGEHRPEETE
jgi:hypothetical protein